MYQRKRKRQKFNIADDLALAQQFMNKGGEVKKVPSAFGLDKNFDDTLDVFYRSNEWAEARGYIFAHTKNECAYCGSIEKLQIDHIRPLRYYWDLRTSLENLQILCEDCNYAKGSNSDYNYHLSELKYRHRQRRPLDENDGETNASSMLTQTQGE
jgi:hypothetical protein